MRPNTCRREVTLCCILAIAFLLPAAAIPDAAEARISSPSVLTDSGVTTAHAPATVHLSPIDPGLTSPSGAYRWLDVADNEYAADYQSTYEYSQANVQLTYDTLGTSLQGTLSASNLKPNFAYQFKLTGSPDTADSERIGLSGRWWEETWDGAQWTNGHNLNNKGDGSSPNPNDYTYWSRRDVVEPSSPTGRLYRYTGYLPIDYFITDESGSATLTFEAHSSYHVLWKTSQRSPGADDGPLKVRTFDPDPASIAYDIDFPESSATVFGEWERIPVGGVYLRPGSYNCMIILTEESFHGSGLAGGWASAVGATISFDIQPTYSLAVAASPIGTGTTSPAPGNHGCAPNQAVLLQAIPAAGYEFAYWGGDVAEPFSSSTSITVTGDMAATAYFQPTGTSDPPVAPTNLSAFLQSGGAVRLSWQDNSDDEAGFIIDRKYRDSGALHEFDRIAADTTAYNDDSVAGGRTYTYRVRAWKLVDGPLGPTAVTSASNQASVTVTSEGGCFIAGSVYGSHLDDRVSALRSFRDDRLSADPPGRGLMSVYYSISPTIASFLDTHAHFKPPVRLLLMPPTAISCASSSEWAAVRITLGVTGFLLPMACVLWLADRRLKHPLRTTGIL